MSQTIFFPKQKDGYDTELVDSYIDKLSEEYKTVYHQYQDVAGKYSELLEAEKQNGSKHEDDAEIMASTIVHAEMLAKQIVGKAQGEIGKAREEAKRIIEDARNEAERIKSAAKKGIDDAHSEVAKLADLVYKSLMSAQETVGQAAVEVRSYSVTQEVHSRVIRPLNADTPEEE